MSSENSNTPELLPEKLDPSAELGVMTFACIALMMAGFGIWHFYTQHEVDRSESDESAPSSLIDFAHSNRSSGLVTFVPEDSKERLQKALSILAISDAQLQIVKDRLKRGEVRLGLIVLWDNQYNDGDIVRLTSAGITQIIEIRNQPRVVALPVTNDMTVSITGERDGGGTITIAAAAGAGSIPLKPMLVGETIRVSLK